MDMGTGTEGPEPGFCRHKTAGHIGRLCRTEGVRFYGDRECLAEGNPGNGKRPATRHRGKDGSAFREESLGCASTLLFISQGPGGDCRKSMAIHYRPM